MCSPGRILPLCECPSQFYDNGSSPICFGFILFLMLTCSNFIDFIKKILACSVKCNDCLGNKDGCLACSGNRVSFP